MYWIKYGKGKNIPQELYYDNYQTDKAKFGRTPLMLWIEWRRGEAIPQELYYRPSAMGSQTSTMSPNYQTYKDEYDETPLMFWIRER